MFYVQKRKKAQKRREHRKKAEKRKLVFSFIPSFNEIYPFLQKAEIAAFELEK